MLIAALQEISRGTEKNLMQVLNYKYILQNVKDFLVLIDFKGYFVKVYFLRTLFFNFLI